ncbi:MAG: coiled-coil domain-containing protein [Candidatus Woesearchaeota archaeon]
MIKKISFFIVFLFLITSINSTLASSQTEINDLGLFVAEHEVEYINYKHLQTANLKFNINTAYKLSSLLLDISELNNLPSKKAEYSNIDFLNKYCHQNNKEETDENDNTYSIFQGYICEMPYVQILMNNLTVNIKFNLTYAEGDIENELINKTISFKLDDTNPEVIELKTSYCEGEICYISDLFTTIELEMKDSVGTFNQKRVFFKIGNEATRVFSNCTQTTCDYKYYVSNCYSKQYLNLQLVAGAGSSSSDDAGNPFSNDGKRTVVCDRDTPSFTIDDISYTYLIAGSAPQNTPLKQQDTITFKINITEDATDVTAYADFEELNDNNNTIEGTCTKSSFGSTCTFVVTAVNAGDINVYFKAKDGVGHEMSEWVVYKIHVDEYLLGDVETPKYFSDVTTKSMAEDGYNRVAIGLMLENSLNVPLYQTFKLNKLLSDEVEIVAYDTIEPAYCYVDFLNGTKTNDATSFEFDVADPYLNWNTENRLDVKFRFNNPNMYPDEFQIVCNVSAYVRVNQNTYYKNPTIFQMKIPIKFRNSALGDDAPGETFAKKIQETEESMKGFWETFDTVEMWISAASDICSIYGQVVGLNTATTSLEVKGLALGGTNVLGAGAHQFSETLLNNKLGDLTGKMCSFLNCNVNKIFAENQDKNSNFWVSSNKIGAGTLEQYTKDNWASPVSSKLFDNLERPNVRESVISSLATGCIPGVVYHVKKYRTARCSQLLCYKQNSKYGLDLMPCDQAFSQYVCSSFVGELFEIPGFRGAKNLIDNTNALIQNAIPNGLSLILHNFGCKSAKLNAKNGITDVWAVWACHVPEAISRVMDNEYKTSSSTQSFTYPSDSTYCNLALCNEEDINNCKDDKPDWINQLQSFNFMDGGRIDYSVTTGSLNAGEMKQLLKSAQSSDDAGIAARNELVERGAPNYLNNPERGKDIYNYCTDQIDAINKLNLKDDQPVGFNLAGTISYDFTPSSAYATAETEYSRLTTNEKYKDLNNRRDDLSKEEEADLKKFDEQIATAQNNMQRIANNEIETIQRTLNDLEGKGKDRTPTEENLYNDLRERMTGYENSYFNVDRAYLFQEQNSLMGKIESVENCINDAWSCNGYGEDIDHNDLNDELIKLQQQLERNIFQLDNKDEFNKNFYSKLARDQNKINQKQKTLEFMNLITDKVLGIMYTNGYLDWFKLSTHEDFQKVADWANTNLNSDNYKDTICSATTDFNKGTTMEGTAVQCINGLCKPVLTMASEKLKINQSHYLYTLTYYLGNVEKPQGAINEKMKYNVFFKPGNQRLFNKTWEELDYYEVADFAQSFLGKGDYTEVCIKFEKPYPPYEQQQELEYCRKIKDSTEGASDYNTGSYNPEYSNQYEPTTSTDGSYVVNDI